METLPRDKVLNFLKEGFKELAIPYLEHIIYVWEEKRAEFHNVLIQLYLEKVQGLMKEYLNSLPEGDALDSMLHYYKLILYDRALDCDQFSFRSVLHVRPDN